MDNKIGVVYSPGVGAGWSTWGSESMALDQELANAVEAKSSVEEIEKIALKNWPDEYMGGLKDLEVMWIEKGDQFRISQYDGSERVEFRDSDDWMTG